MIWMTVDFSDIVAVIILVALVVARIRWVIKEANKK